MFTIAECSPLAGVSHFFDDDIDSTCGAEAGENWRRLVQTLAATVRGGGATWAFGRQRGPSIG